MSGKSVLNYVFVKSFIQSKITKACEWLLQWSCMNHWFSKPLQWVQEQSFCAACLNSVHVHCSKFIIKNRKVLILWLIPWSMHDAPIHESHTNFLKPNNWHFVYLRWKCASLEKQTLFNKSWLTSHSVNAILCRCLLAVNLSNAVILYGHKCIYFFKIYTLQRLPRNLMFCCCFSCLLYWAHQRQFSDNFNIIIWRTSTAVA